jgi:hypothetical protein
MVAGHPMSMKRRRTIGILAAGTLLSVLALGAAAYILLPRLVNAERVRTMIEGAVARSLGGTLVYDRIALQAFPRPRVRFLRAEVAIPGKVTASLSSLDLSPALRPLLRGTLQISEVRLVQPNVTIQLSPGPARTRLPGAASAGEAHADAPAAPALDLDMNIEILGGTIALVRGKEPVVTVRDLSCRSVFLARHGISSMSASEEKNLFVVEEASGKIDAPFLTLGMADVTLSHLEAGPRSVTFEGGGIRMNDLSLKLSGRIDDYLAMSRKAHLTATGTAGPHSLLWLRDSLGSSWLPSPRGSLSLLDSKIVWESDGTVRATGAVHLQNGTAVTFDLMGSTGRFILRRLAIHDSASDAKFSLSAERGSTDISFEGRLSGSSLSGLFSTDTIRFSLVRGNLRLHLAPDTAAITTADGVLEGQKVVVPWKQGVVLTLDHVVLRGQGRELQLDPATVSLGKSSAEFRGSLSGKKNGMTFDLDMTSPELDWDDLRELFSPQTKGADGGTTAASTRNKNSMEGTLRMEIAALRGKGYLFESVRGSVVVEQQRTRCIVREMKVCGITAAGNVSVAQEKNELSFTLSARNQDLGGSSACLAGKDLQVSGNFDLAGNITGKGTNDELLRSLVGKVSFAARNGRIYNDYILTPVLKHKRMIDLFGRKIGNIQEKGIPYDTFELQGNVQNSALSISEAVIKSPLLNLAANGEVNLIRERLDITVLVAPFRNMDVVVKKIPLVGDILGGTLVTVPFGVHGPFHELKVTPLPPSAIGEGLLGIMRRTLELPFKAIEDVDPRERSAATTSLAN